MAAGNIRIETTVSETSRISRLRAPTNLGKGAEFNGRDARAAAGVWGALLLYWRRREIMGLPRGR